MSKTNKGMSVFLRLCLCLVLLTTLFGVLGVAYKYIGNGQRNFYVRYGGEIVASTTKDYVFEKDAYTVFYCGTVMGQTVDYDVQIFLNTKNIENFDFSVDDKRKNFASDFAEYDCVKLFGFLKADNYFCLSVSNGLTLKSIVQSKYPDAEVITDVPDVVLNTANSFILAITDGVENTKTQIYFS